MLVEWKCIATVCGIVNRGDEIDNVKMCKRKKKNSNMTQNVLMIKIATTIQIITKSSAPLILLSVVVVVVVFFFLQ